MPTGGIIQIETEATEWDETTVSRHPDARTGKFVCLTVSDRGCGMEAKVLNHIFEPFFTTKEVGKGTGLGLSTILGIVKQHDGWIDVSSEVGRGSSFRIYLPACNGIPAPRSDNHTDYLALRESGQGETVLVVEDESSVCDLACSALEKHGYKVIRAADGPEAIQAWERSSEPVDLLLTDIVMPSGMSGSELAKELQTRNAQLKIIFTSGYSTEIIHEDSFRPNEINFLPKPYDLQTLLKSVRQCLNSGTPGRSRNSSDLIVEPTVA
ncbi:MAG TPA: response regulator, partial [Verrucomicrobiae bacterium]|nr:response regulator [Verrucomicrobiae bacterium]